MQSVLITATGMETRNKSMPDSSPFRGIFRYYFIAFLNIYEVARKEAQERP